MSRTAWVALLSLPLAGQEVLWERNGQNGSPCFYDYAKFVGDVDGDGFDDLVTRAHSWLRGSPPELLILSGRDGRTLRAQPLPPGNQVFFDSWDEAGDFDRDGTPDYAFSAHENQSPFRDLVHVHSGRDGSLILRLESPSGLPYAPASSVLGGRDVTGDGRPDLVMRWVRSAGEAIVGAFDHTGRRLYRHVGSFTTRSYTVGAGLSGNGLGWVGDLDGDGADDFVLGSYDAGVGRYVALVLSGRTGLVLRTGIGTSAYIGWAADGCGDIDRDGVPDFVASAQRYPGASVDVFSGRTGQIIRTWVEDGGVLRSGGFDFDRDGVPDVLFLRGGAEGGMLVNSGRDGAWTHRLLGCHQSGGTRRDCIYATDGAFLEVGRPQPGNPYPVFVFPEAYYGSWTIGKSTYPLGRIRMYRGTPPGVEPYGTACTGTLPARSQMGIRDLQGSGVRVHLYDAPPGAHAALLLGFSRTQWQGISLPASLAPLGLPGCSLFTSVDLYAKTWAGTLGVDRGYAFVDLPLPLRLPGQETFTLHGQWLVLDPVTLGAAVTDAHSWRH